MKNYDPGDQASIAEFVLKSLPSHKHFSLGTVDDKNRPWVVYLQLIVGEGVDIVWVSRIDAEHSKHITKRPQVAICIASETPRRGDFIFYGYAEASRVTNKTELARLLELRADIKSQPVPPTADFLSPSPMGLYRATLQEAWINDDSHLKTKVDLNTLRELAKQR